MTTVESDKPPNTVVHVLQKGYTLTTGSCGRRW